MRTAQEVPLFGICPIQKGNQVPCQEQDHESDLQSLQYLHKQPRPVKSCTCKRSTTIKQYEVEHRWCCLVGLFLEVTTTLPPCVAAPHYHCFHLIWIWILHIQLKEFHLTQILLTRAHFQQLQHR